MVDGEELKTRRGLVPADVGCHSCPRNARKRERPKGKIVLRVEDRAQAIQPTVLLLGAHLSCYRQVARTRTW